MSNYKRVKLAGRTYFFTVVTFQRSPLFATPLARRCLREAWFRTCRSYPITTDAICVNPEHLHCLWTLPEADSEYALRWRMIKGLFSKIYLAAGGTQGHRNSSRRRKGEAALWQRRFWEHCIRDEEDLRKHMDYIHFNPVKHGLVSSAADWPWSSFGRYVRMGWYDAEWGSTEPKGLLGLEQCGE